MALAAISFLSAPPHAEAQIVRHIIGHAVAGKAVKSILGQDKDAGKDADASDSSSGEGARAAHGALSQDTGPAQKNPDR